MKVTIELDNFNEVAILTRDYQIIALADTDITDLPEELEGEVARLEEDGEYQTLAKLEEFLQIKDPVHIAYFVKLCEEITIGTALSEMQSTKLKKVDTDKFFSHDDEMYEVIDDTYKVIQKWPEGWLAEGYLRNTQRSAKEVT
jgi:hypothetical protein